VTAGKEERSKGKEANVKEKNTTRAKKANGKKRVILGNRCGSAKWGADGEGGEKYQKSWVEEVIARGSGLGEGRVAKSRFCTILRGRELLAEKREERKPKGVGTFRTYLKENWNLVPS